MTRKQASKKIFLVMILFFSPGFLQKGHATEKKFPWTSTNHLTLVSTQLGASLIWSQYDTKTNKSRFYQVELDEKGQARDKPSALGFFQKEIKGEVTLLKGEANSVGTYSLWLVAVVKDKLQAPTTTKLYVIHYIQSLTASVQEKVFTLLQNPEYPQVEITAVSDGGILIVAPGLGRICKEKTQGISQFNQTDSNALACMEPLALYIDANNQEKILGNLNLTTEGTPLSISKPINLGGCALFSGILSFWSVRPYHEILCYRDGKIPPSFVLPWESTHSQGIAPRRIWTGTQLLTLIPKTSELPTSSLSGSRIQMKSTFWLYLESPNQVIERQKFTAQKFYHVNQMKEHCVSHLPVLDIDYTGGHIQIDPIQAKISLQNVFPREVWTGKMLLSLNEKGVLQKRMCLADGRLSEKETIIPIKPLQP